MSKIHRYVGLSALTFTLLMGSRGLAQQSPRTPEAARAPSTPSTPFEPEFSGELLVYKHERDGLAAMKSTLAIVDTGISAGVLATSKDPYTLGFAGVSALRALDLTWEVSLLLGRHLLVDAEITTRADIRVMRRKWQRVVLVSALINAAVGSLASIGWLTSNNEWVKGICTGVTFQTGHSIVEQMIEAVVMRPWPEKS
jgi:hypothetical protein